MSPTPEGRHAGTSPQPDPGQLVGAPGQPEADPDPQPPGTISGFLWPTEFLLFCDFLVAEPHEHSALQLAVGLEAQPRLYIDGTWHEVPGVVIDTGMAHGLDVSGRLTAIGWVEAEGRLGQELRERFLGGRPRVTLSTALAAEIAEAWWPALDPSTPCDDAFERWRAGIIALSGQVEPSPPVEPRIQAVVDHLRMAPSPPPSVTELMDLANLSERRLQQLFREQVGVPIRRYLLWQRVLTAMRSLVAGASATEAAHAAGFTDSAHLTRTAHRMSGIVPSAMAAMAPWVTDCC